MTIRYCDWTEEQLTYPEFYKDKDRDWIGSQLSRLTFDHRKKICAEYREVYLKEGRNPANQLLLDYCKDNGARHQVTRQPSTESRNPLQDKIDKIRSQPCGNRKTILGMADNHSDKRG